jgi:hypothetical protein
VEPAVDITKLSGAAQKMLDPQGPAPLRKLAARAIAPGLRPHEAVTVCALLAEGEGELADEAKATLQKLPTPILNGALTGDLPPGVIDRIAPLYAKDPGVAQKLLMHAAILASTVAAMAALASEAVCELIATNEERLLTNPEIIEKLYLNSATRMSTADRMIELAVRNGLKLTGIPAFEEAAKAIEGELLEMASDEPSIDDQQFNEVKSLAKETQLADGEDVVRIDEASGEEVVDDKFQGLFGAWSSMRVSAKIRLVQSGAEALKRSGEVHEKAQYDQAAIRLLAVRDNNPLVAMAGIKAPGMQENEVVRISAMRNVSEDVLREVAKDKEWTRSYQIKLNLVGNPRTPFAFSSRLIAFLRDNDLKRLAGSRDVPGAVQAAVKQHLSRKAK